MDEELEELLESCGFYDELCVVPEDSSQKNNNFIAQFLGTQKQIQAALTRPAYYGDLLAWALQRYIESAGWRIANVTGLSGRVPRYTSVNTDYGRHESVLCYGYLLLQKRNSRVVACIRVIPMQEASLVMLSRSKKEAYSFAQGVDETAQGQNMYQGKKLEFARHIRFLKLPSKNWDDLTLDSTVKYDIQANTVGFLNRLPELAGYGIPPKRGVILVGEPGTGKTLICKTLINHSPEITCIVAYQGALGDSTYIYNLYELAQDLAPSIVFIEDIDLVGQDREESNYCRGEGLFTLLKALDGVEECDRVVTVATANSLETLDKALRERPSRFDRIIQLLPPSLEQRKEFIQSLSQRIPMDEDAQDYLARWTEGYTPAQIQELAYSLAIEHKHRPGCNELGHCKFDVEEVKNVLSRRNKKNKVIGFRKLSDNGNGSGVNTISQSRIKA